MKKLVYSSLLVVGVTVVGFAATVGGGTCWNTVSDGDQYGDVCRSQECTYMKTIDTSVGEWTNCGIAVVGIE
ncbi:MAG: hypothetical protein R8G66_18370 [Cytophagales bacterium]|nr:hypothetical protein [Cytophagales bacterium]